jgi:hypothetical protein
MNKEELTNLQKYYREQVELSLKESQPSLFASYCDNNFKKDQQRQKILFFIIKKLKRLEDENKLLKENMRENKVEEDLKDFK